MQNFESKSSVKAERLAPKYARQNLWLVFGVCLFIYVNAFTQDKTYNSPDVNIYDSPEQDFELPGSGDYIPAEQIREYNLQNINDILRNATGVYSREEGGYGLFPNISLRGASTLRSAAVTMMEDGINIAPAPYSAPDAYYSPLAGKMHAIEILKGSSQFRYGPHTTGGVINYQTTPVDFGERYFGSVSYGAHDDKTTHAYANYGVSGSFGALAVLGEIYFRENDGFRDFNGPVDPDGAGPQAHYGSDDAGGLHQFAPMAKILWQLPTDMKITLELKGALNQLDYYEGYAGLTTADFNADPYQRYVASQLDNMNSEAQTYYTKLHTEFNQNIKNTLTLYYNDFTRDWYKLDKVNNDSLNEIVSKAYAGLNGTGNLNIYKGIAAGNIEYKSNDRAYYAYGLMNQSDFDFNTNFFNRDIKHDLKVGFKFHYDKINRDQYVHDYTQATTGVLTPTGTTFNADRNQITKGAAVYFEENATINNFVVSLGSRFEYVKQTYRSGATTSDSEKTYAFVPGGGLTYNHDDNWQWYGAVYKGFSMPSPSASRDDGTPLQPEKSLAKEIGVRYSDQNLSVSVIGFHTNFKDVIVLDNSNTGSDADNAGKVVSKGLELMTAYSPEDFLSFPGDTTFYVNYTFTNANLDGDSTSTDTESIFAYGLDGNNVPYIPEHVLSFGVDYKFQKFDFGINVTHHSESYGTAAETESEISGTNPDARAGRIDSATLLNLRAGYEINDNYKLVAGVNNLTDLEYVSSRHPAGARAGKPLTAWVKAVANFDSIFSK